MLSIRFPFFAFLFLLTSCQRSPQEPSAFTFQLQDVQVFSYTSKTALLTGPKKLKAPGAFLFLDAGNMSLNYSSAYDFQMARSQSQEYHPQRHSCGLSAALEKLLVNLSTNLSCENCKNTAANIFTNLNDTDSCAVTDLLQCVDKRLALNKGSEVPISSTVSKNAFEFCLTGKESTNQPSFSLANGKISFEPNFLYAITVYEGAVKSYEDALLNRVAVASISPELNCKREDKACLSSPVLISKCPDCNTFVSGKTYTAFLIPAAFSPSEKILVVPFSAP